jgi:quercetin dioxygenase-like cupin family protein
VQRSNTQNGSPKAVANDRRTSEKIMTAPLSRNSILHTAHMPDAADINQRIMTSYGLLREEDWLRRSHFFGGRHENLYLNHDRIPELKRVLQQATTYASMLLGKAESSLKRGFWLNEMKPGQSTSKHDHDEDDELLSAVYYIHVPENSGRLIIHDKHSRTEVEPVPGMFVFFGPTVMHSVSANQSSEKRLSMAMNFGPA